MKIKLTKDCFTDKKLFHHRDSYLDNWLPREQKETGIKGEMKSLDKEMTFQEIYTEFNPPIISLVDIENMIGKEDANLNTNGYANFFFVNDKDGNVSVVYAYRFDRQWNVYVYRLDYGHRWDAERRFFLSNGKLESLDALTPLGEAIEIVKKAGYQISKII